MGFFVRHCALSISMFLCTVEGTRQTQASSALNLDAQWRPATPTSMGAIDTAWEAVRKLAAAGSPMLLVDYQGDG